MKSAHRRLLWLAVLTPMILMACLAAGPSGFRIWNLSPQVRDTVFFLRLDRILVSFLVGAALSSAGAVFQALLRNPLAEPYVLGVSSGAGLGAALAILGGWTAHSVAALPLSASVGSVITLLVVYHLAGGRGLPSVYSIILSGVIVSTLCSSVLMFLVSTASTDGLHSVLWWMLGNLQPASVPLLIFCGAIMVAGCAALWAMAPELNALTLGREVAHFLGIPTGFFLAAGLLLATVVSSAAVALAGLIGFVGLIVPHVARGLFGPDHRVLIPACFLGGGVFLAVCDSVARTVLAPVEIPVGVITALCGGPFFLFVLKRKRRQGWLE